MKQFYIVNKKGFFNLYGLWLLSFLLLCASVFSERVITLRVYKDTMQSELMYLYIIRHVNHTLEALNVEHKKNRQSSNEESTDEVRECFPLEEAIFYNGIRISLYYDYELVNVEFININRKCQFQIHYEREQYFIMGIEYITNTCNI